MVLNASEDLPIYYSFLLPIFLSLFFSLHAMENRELDMSPKEKLNALIEYVTNVAPYDSKEENKRLLFAQTPYPPLMSGPILVGYAKHCPIEVITHIRKIFSPHSTKRDNKYVLGLLRCINGAVTWSYNGDIKDVDDHKLIAFILEQPHIKLLLSDEIIRNELLRIIKNNTTQGDVVINNNNQKNMAVSRNGENKRKKPWREPFSTSETSFPKGEFKAAFTALLNKIKIKKNPRIKTVNLDFCDVSWIEQMVKSSTGCRNYMVRVLECKNHLDNENYPGLSVYNKERLEEIQNIQYSEFSKSVHSYISARLKLLYRFRIPSVHRDEILMRNCLKNYLLSNMQDEKSDNSNRSVAALRDKHENANLRTALIPEFFKKRDQALQKISTAGNKPKYTKRVLGENTKLLDETK